MIYKNAKIKTTNENNCCLISKRMYTVCIQYFILYFFCIYILRFSSYLVLELWCLTPLSTYFSYIVEFSFISRLKQTHVSRSNGLSNFRSNGLQVVALLSVLYRSFVLSIRSNVLRRFYWWRKNGVSGGENHQPVASHRQTLSHKEIYRKVAEQNNNR